MRKEKKQIYIGVRVTHALKVLRCCRCLPTPACAPYSHPTTREGGLQEGEDYKRGRITREGRTTREGRNTREGRIAIEGGLQERMDDG